MECDTIDTPQPKIGLKDVPMYDREISQLTSSHQVDSAYSWLIAAIGFANHFIIFGTFSTFGVYLARFTTHEFQNEPQLLLSLIGGLGPAIYSVFCLPVGVLVAKVGSRFSIVAGGIIFAVGLLLSSFATQLWHLFIGQSLFLGVGVSLVFIPTISIVPQWFDKYQGICLGLTVSGSGLGGLVLAPLIQAIIDSIGLQWAFRIHAIIAAAVLIPGGLIIQPRIQFQEQKIFDKEVIIDPRFIAMWGMGMASCFPFFVPFFLMPIYCDAHGISASTGSLIVGIMNGAAAIGRIITGRISDKLGSINTLLICHLLTALTFVLIWGFSTQVWSLILFGVLFGIFSSAFFPITAVLAPQLFGFKKLAQVNGPFYTCCAPGYMLGTMIATSILNAYKTDEYVNNWPNMFYLFGMYLLSCVFLVWLRYLTSTKLMVKV